MKQLFVEAIVKETHTIKHRINVTGISPTKIDDLLKYGDPQENPSDKDHKLSWEEFDHSIVDGSEITIGSITFAAQQVGKTSAYQIYIAGDGNNFVAVDKALISLPKTEIGFGSRTINAEVSIANKPNISSQSFESENIDIQSDTPPVPHIGFDTDLLDTELSAASLMANGLKVTDVIRIPEINANHILEIVSLPQNVVIEVAGAAIPSNQIFEVVTNYNPEPLHGVRLSASDLETAVIKLSKETALGTENLDFKTRVGIPDGIVVESAETRYSYSRFVEFNYNLDINFVII